MNVIATELTASAPVDAVRAMPRRVVGFHTVIESNMELEDVRASLEGLAERSAFHLVSLDECTRGTGEQGRELCAEFALSAQRGTVGDTQIFALLREVAARHRWNTMEKRLER